MMKRAYIIALVMISQLGFAQNVKFGKISKEELQEKEYVDDKAANAAILYSDRVTYYALSTNGTQLVTEVHKRIKIYNKDGFKYATQQISLFKTRNDKENVSKLKAYTYNLEGDKIVETKLEKDQIFHNEISYNFKGVSFTMPNLHEGSVIEFKYTITSPFIWNIDEFKFQSDIPIKQLVAELRTPKDFDFKATQKGFLSFYSRPGNAYNDMKSVIYELNNIPALKEESYVDNMNNYRAGVMFELVSIIIPGVVHRTYAQTWSDVAKTIGSSEDYKKELDKTNSFDDELDGLLGEGGSQVEKMKRIFKYVKDNITWNGIDGKYFFNGIRKTLKEKKGNVGDINLTLVAMLRYAGIKANPVVISTKDNIIPMFPTVDRLNYVVAYARIDDEVYFLDATDEFSDINILPIKDYNWRGVYIDNPNSRWDLIDLKQPKKAVDQYMLNASLNPDGSIEGNLKTRCSNHSALKFRESYKDKDLETFVADREGALDNIEISEYNASNTDSYEGLVSESFNFYYENGASVIANDVFINPFMFFKLEENPFKSEERKFPIDFGAPFQNRYLINIKIPDGYQLKSQPEPVSMAIPKGIGKFLYKPKVTGNMIQLMVNFEINDAIIGPDNYLFLKEFFNQMIIKESEQIVLTKV